MPSGLVIMQQYCIRSSFRFRHHEGSAGGAYSHWAAQRSLGFQASGDCVRHGYAAYRLLQHRLQRRARGRPQRNAQAPDSDFRSVHRQTWRHLVLDRLSLWLGLQGAGCPQWHRCSIHHSSRPGDSFQQRFDRHHHDRLQPIVVEQDHGHSSPGRNGYRHPRQRHKAGVNFTRSAYYGGYHGARRRAGGGRLDMACQWGADWKIRFKR